MYFGMFKRVIKVDCKHWHKMPDRQREAHPPQSQPPIPEPDPVESDPAGPAYPVIITLPLLPICMPIPVPPPPALAPPARLKPARLLTLLGTMGPEVPSPWLPPPLAAWLAALPPAPSARFKFGSDGDYQLNTK